MPMIVKLKRSKVWHIGRAGGTTACGVRVRIHTGVNDTARNKDEIKRLGGVWCQRCFE